MNPTWNIDEVPKFRNHVVEWMQNDELIVSYRNSLYSVERQADSRRHLCTFPIAFSRQLISRARLGQRLFRCMFTNVIPLDGETLFMSFDKQVGIFAKGRYHLIEKVSPYRIIRGGAASDGSGHVYWGEYHSNDERQPVKIYRYGKGDVHADVVWTFPRGEIRHVHGVYFDPFTGHLWVTTGDRSDECKIAITDDGFRSLHTIGGGDESWRAVSLLFTEQAIFYASDAEYVPNHIYRIDRRTIHRHLVGDTDGPVYYSQSIGDDLLFAVTAELCPSQQEKSAALYHWSQEGGSHIIRTWRKDLLASRILTKLFMPGLLHFPRGNKMDTETYISCIGLRGVDNKVFRITKYGRP